MSLGGHEHPVKTRECRHLRPAKAQGRDSCGSRKQFPEQLDPFRSEFVDKAGQPRDIPARACETPTTPCRAKGSA